MSKRPRTAAPKRRSRGSVPLPRKTGRKSKAVSETERRLDELWAWFEGSSRPSAAQMDEWLDALLALPTEATSWSEVLHACAEKTHAELPAVFRKIAAAVPHTRETKMSFFYWAAAEEFARHGLSAVLPEVASGFMRLDERTYDADALAHLQDMLLAERLETEALALAKRFLSIVSGDGGLMPYAAIEQCNLVFQLRAGMALRGALEASTSPGAVAQALRDGLEEDIEDEAIDRAARVACDAADPAWTRACFNLVTGDIRESEQAWRDCLRLYDALLRVAREAWRSDGVPPGWAFVALERLLASVYRSQGHNESPPRGDGKTTREPRTGNLLDYLNASGLEERIARACPDVLGVNVAGARILVDAHALLLDFAARHALVADRAADANHAELARLRRVLVSG